MIELKEFLSRITIEPSFVGKDLDGVIIVQWPDTKEKLSPSLEFGTRVRDDGTQYLYFEIVDFGHGYMDGDIIPFDDTARRQYIISSRLDNSNITELANCISNALSVIYNKLC